MLTLWTGLPGSGKTSGFIQRVLMPLAAKDWLEDAIDDEGKKVKIKRRLLTNINGLLLEHEKIDAADLLTWPEWVKPGDLIVFDEVQKPWPLTGANKEQPKCITELETHRHYGIDMHLMTQHPMLVNAALCRLAGQHLHVRKLGNSRLATIYEWDGVSRTLLYKNSFAKKPFRRSKAVEKLYRSSAMHTKQRRSLPTVLFVLLLAVGFVSYMGPSVYVRIQERANPTAVVAGEASKPKPGTQAAEVVATKAPGEAPKHGDAAPVAFLGCAAFAQRCDCYMADGTVVDKGPGFCSINTRGMKGEPPRSLDRLVIPDQELHQRALASSDQDHSLLAWAGAREGAQARAAALPAPVQPVAPAKR